MKPTAQLVFALGIGVLSWGRGERVSDRYGAVMLMELDPDGPEQDMLRRDDSLVGKRGTLAVTIEEVRESGHIGDLFRCIQPGGAVKDETLVLGEGTLFYERVGEYCVVGVQPDEDRDSDWLDPHKLYRAHECVVRLTFTVGDNS